MKKRTQFTFYESFFSAISRIEDDSVRAQTYDIIISYALYGTIPDLNNIPEITAIIFELIRPNLDASRRKAEGGQAGKNSCQNEEDESKNTERSNQEVESKNKNKDEDEDEDEDENKVKENSEVKDHGSTTEAIADVIDYFKLMITPTISQSAIRKLKSYLEKMDADVCKRAIDYAVDANVLKWSYIDAILQDKQSQGIQSLEDWDLSEKEHHDPKCKGKDDDNNGTSGKLTPAGGNYGKYV